MISKNMVELLSCISQSPHTLDMARLKANAFTRNRGMTFPDTLAFMLDMRKTTLQTRLNHFFEHVKGGKPISQQAFSQLRMNFSHSPFEKMVREQVREEYSGRYALPLWNGFHLFAIDGSYLQLPRTDVLRDEFGVRGRGCACPVAGISVLYDVLHCWAMDPVITVANMNERAECEKHVAFLRAELTHLESNSILLLDRGYPSLDLFEKLQSSGLNFLARCSSEFLSEINSSPMGDSVVALKNGLPLRVFKFVLSSGEVETLATNLFDLPHSLFPELYALRWGIETAYFRLKRELCVEKFSGKTPNSIRQDFWASMVLLNAVAVFQKEADESVHDRQAAKVVKNHARARTSDLIITLRDRFIFSALCGFDPHTDFDCIIKTMARVTSPIRPGRSFSRNFKPAFAVNHNLKSFL